MKILTGKNKAMGRDKFSDIKQLIGEHDVVLFMKGTKGMPQCGFSALTSQILQKFNLPFHDVNVLEDFGLREDIKKFSDWPTIPQLYIKGEFIGGCDIVSAMHQSGELESLLKEQNLLK